MGRAKKKAGQPGQPETFAVPESVVLLLGDAWYPRWRFCRELAARAGKRLVRVAGPADAARAARLGSGAIWLVEGADQVPLSDLVAESAEAGALLLLQSDADPEPGTSLAAVAAKVAAARVRSFKKPPPWEEAQGAVDFVRSQMREQGLAAAPGAAEVLAEGSGGDLGYLHFEVLKVCAAARAAGTSFVGEELARQCSGGSLHGDVDRVAAALGEGGAAVVGAALQQVRTSQRQDPTPRLVAVLDRVVGQWLCAALLGDPDPERAARAVGVHPFVYRTRVAGPARRWKAAGLVRVLGVLARADAAVRRGSPSPYTCLCAGLLRACLDLGQGRI